MTKYLALLATLVYKIMQQRILIKMNFKNSYRLKTAYAGPFIPFITLMIRSNRSVLYLIFCLGLLTGACDKPQYDEKLFVIDGLTMGTSYTIKINAKLTAAETKQITDGINSILNDVNQKMSTYITDSELSHINQARTSDWIMISDELYTVVKSAIEIGQLTNGAFDITIGPVVNLWGFGPENRPEQVPSESDIHHALQQTGYHHLQLMASPAAIKKGRNAAYLDLSGIAKGRAVDRIANYLLQHHYRNFMVEIGGEVSAKGINKNGISWRIGIEKPVTKQRIVQRIISLDNISMATSGDYRNYFEQNGLRYSHTIDPKTGHPITHKLASVTVLHPSAMVADALATGLLVMGTTAGYELAEKQNIAALFLTGPETLFNEKYTKAFKTYLVEQD